MGRQVRTLFQSLKITNINQFKPIKHKSVNKQTTFNVGKIIFKNSMEENNVSTIFGISGGAIMPIIDGLYDSKSTKLIVNSNEQCVGHAATGYAKTSGKTGVCIITSGPGLTNMITPMLDAQNDSTPLVVFSGQVPLSAQGTNAFQEAPSVELTSQFTKWSYQVTDINLLSTTIDRAFEIANEGKPGVVHIDIPKCVSYQEYNYEDTNSYLLNKKLEDNIYPSDNIKCKSIYNYDSEHYKKIGDLINNAKKPILYIGQGCKDASYELTRLAILGNIPVTSTIHGTGIFDEHNDLSLRWCGMHGYAPANFALQDADLIIAIGSRFDDRTTGALEKYAPVAKEASKNGTGGIIHCNIESSELDFVVKSDYNFCLDSKEFINNLIPFIRSNTRSKWINEINDLKEKYPFEIKRHSVDLHIEDVIDRIYRKTLDKKAVFTTGVGNHQMQTYQFIKSQYPGKIISSGSLGVMGAGLPYAIGAQFANPNDMVICIDGDSSFNMTLNDMKTIVEHNLPVKIAIMNNNAQMMVTVWEKLFFEERYTATINERNPDYVELAKSFGIKARRCGDARNLNEDIDYFINYNKGPILMEFAIKRDICLPLVKPGCALDDMVLPGDVDLSEIKGKGLVPS